MEKLIRVKNKETDEILFMVKGSPSRYIEGDEYVPVIRFPEDKITKYLKRKSIVMNWKE